LHSREKKKGMKSLHTIGSEKRKKDDGKGEHQRKKGGSETVKSFSEKIVGRDKFLPNTRKVGQEKRERNSTFSWEKGGDVISGLKKNTHKKGRKA